MTVQANDVLSPVFEAAIRPYLGELRNSAMRMCRSQSESDDLLQEATFRAWSFWNRFEQGTNLRAWLHRILTNAYINGYRRRRRELVLLTEGAAWTGDFVQAAGNDLVAANDFAPADRDGVSDEVYAALGELPEEFRDVIVRIDVDEQSYKEVAAALGCPIGTVMSRLHRARRLLRNTLRSYAVTEGYASWNEAEAAAA